MDLEDLNIYKLALSLADEIWDIVDQWNYFSKDTVGKQWVRSADSIAANISEGFGRYFYKETINFTYYARGSLFETKTWLKKAHKRELVSKEKHEKLETDIKDLGIKINNYITTIKNNIK